MKIQNIIRMQAVVVGFAGALLLASVAPAQEIVNQEWAERPGATAPFQAEPAQAAVAPAALSRRCQRKACLGVTPRKA